MFSRTLAIGSGGGASTRRDRTRKLMRVCAPVNWQTRTNVVFAHTDPDTHSTCRHVLPHHYWGEGGGGNVSKQRRGGGMRRLPADNEIKPISAE